MEHLRAGLAAGDEMAFAQMYDLCADRLHRYLVLRLGSPADADDVLQETFVRLVRHTRKLKHVSSIAAYVFTVARNEASRFAHRKRRAPNAGGVLTADVLYTQLGDDLSRRETAELVAQALGELPRAQREVVELKVYAELTFREIAEITGSPQGTVATRYRTALEHLRRGLAELYP
jgi:RNA polymerase sigma-70 factor (ECF subfamily)